jgi:hypothetical protein
LSAARASRWADIQSPLASHSIRATTSGRSRMGLS